MPSQKDLTMLLQYLLNAFSISEKVIRRRKNTDETYDAEHRSSPAAAPVLAGAAPKPNPPAIKCAESKANNATANSKKK
jgi:hypothetical protein